MPRPPGAPWWQDADHVEANWNPEDTHTPPANVELTDEWANAIRDAYEAIRALMPNTHQGADMTAENDQTPTWAGLFGMAPGIDLTGEDQFQPSCCHWPTVYEDSVPDPEGSVLLHDHFSATVELRIAEIQPQYGLVQLNAMRRACGCLVSCDVNRADFLAAVAKVLNVTITANQEPHND